MSKGMIKVRLLFAVDGEFHHETVEIPKKSASGYDRLIDCLREDEAVLKRLHVDIERLVSASLQES